VDRGGVVPFESIESTQEYFALLLQTILEAKRDVEAEIILRQRYRPSQAREVDGFRLVMYQLEKLERHTKASSRTLNDLRMLRRRLLNARVGLVVES
jgi:hypothetical protein